jgi:hypothetical protein
MFDVAGAGDMIIVPAMEDVPVGLVTDAEGWYTCRHEEQR